MTLIIQIRMKVTSSVRSSVTFQYVSRS